MTFYFYDLETSGISARRDRIMQFAGQRTDIDLKPIGEPDNILIKLTDDVLPEPDAILIHGITPQLTRAEGMGEAEALKYLISQVFTPDTLSVGYNNIRFDDDFMRFALWRNFFDAYEWQWKDGRSRWDLLDVVRMTRALRPDGIKWPFASDGKPSNRLELISSINNLEHVNAHDALSDVRAVIAVARLIYNKQTKLFEHLLNLRDKRKVAALVAKGDPLIYSSGRYPSEYEKTTIAVMVAPHPNKNGALMYDLRINPDEFTKLSPEQLASLWQLRGKEAPYFPVKTLSYNRCPAISGSLELISKDKDTQERLSLDAKTINDNYRRLLKSKDFGDKLIRALEITQPQKQPELVIDPQKVDEQLYDGFVNDADKTKMSVVRAADESELSELYLDFADERLGALLPLYKARNFPKSLNRDEQAKWEKFRAHRLLDGGDNSRAARYFKRLGELAERVDLSEDDRYLLEELKLYGQAVVPLET